MNCLIYESNINPKLLLDCENENLLEIKVFSIVDKFLQSHALNIELFGG